MEVSEKLKTIRSKLNLSQRDLGKKLNLSRGYISDLEIGAKQPSERVNRRINNFYKKHFCKKEPLVEVMVPEKPKKNWLVRLIEWFLEK